jgi:hypothetical protein
MVMKSVYESTTRYAGLVESLLDTFKKLHVSSSFFFLDMTGKDVAAAWQCVSAKSINLGQFKKVQGSEV